MVAWLGLVCMAGLTGVACLTACSPTFDWRTVRLEHAVDLQAVFPCKPAQLSRTLSLPGLPGASVAVHLASCQVGDSTWALTYFDAQEIGRVPVALASDIQSLRDNFQAATRLAVKSPTAAVSANDLGPANVRGMTPNPQARYWRLSGQRANGQGDSVPFEVHAWHFSHGLMVYQATVWRPIPPGNAKDSTDSVETFIQGFKFSD